jgi:MFS family permease
MPERKPYAPPPIAERTPALAGRDPYAAFRFRAYIFYALGNFISITGRQMLTVAIEWEVYARTHSATALGLVGLVAAVPIVALSLPAGHLADRFSRKSIILWTQASTALCSICLALISWNHLRIPRLAILLQSNNLLRSIAVIFERHPSFHFDDLSLPLLYLVMLITAAVRTFSWAARSSFFPTLVPRESFANAITWNSSIFQVSCVLGPAMGGFLIVRLGFPFIYALDAVSALVFFFLVLPIQRIRVGWRGARGAAWRKGSVLS